MIRTTILASLLAYTSITAQAQETQPFKGYLYNAEYQVYLNINFYQNNMLIPGQEILGQLPGYFGTKRDTRKWLIIDAQLDKESHTAQLQISNDYGSEDLKATLTQDNDSTYTLKQGAGSTIKIAVNRKWVKIPKTLRMIKK